MEQGHCQTGTDLLATSVHSEPVGLSAAVQQGAQTIQYQIMRGSDQTTVCQLPGALLYTQQQSTRGTQTQTASISLVPIITARPQSNNIMEDQKTQQLQPVVESKSVQITPVVIPNRATAQIQNGQVVVASSAPVMKTVEKGQETKQVAIVEQNNKEINASVTQLQQSKSVAQVQVSQASPSNQRLNILQAGGEKNCKVMPTADKTRKSYSSTKRKTKTVSCTDVNIKQQQQLQQPLPQFRAVIPPTAGIGQAHAILNSATVKLITTTAVATNTTKSGPAVTPTPDGNSQNNLDQQQIQASTVTKLLIIMANGQEVWLTYNPDSQLPGGTKENDQLTDILKKAGIPEDSLEEVRISLIKANSSSPNKTNNKAIAAADLQKPKEGEALVRKSEGEISDCPKKKPKATKKSKKVEEPVCLTISSDDEDGADQNSSSKQEGNTVGSETQFAVNCDPAITHAAMLKEPVIPEDEEEASSEEKSEEQTPAPSPQELLQAASQESLPSPDSIIDTADGLTAALNCRTVRIGSYKIVPEDFVFINPLGIFITIPSIEDENKIIRLRIPFDDIVKILVHYGRGMPVLFIYTTPTMGSRIRRQLKMISKDSYYYDPASKVETQKRITLLPEKITDDCRNKFKKIFSVIPRPIHEELNSKEANDILVRASPKEVQNSLKKTLMNSSAISQEIQTIMVYPPPPAKGGIPINTEDYACLGEDQFLNDVIIDFYLKYIIQSMLSEENQARTHVLSTFFYKRLTTKPSGSRRLYNPIESDPNSTAAEKRHSRVKSWTKAVNIFEKDFIIIPINEHSHWFLAIICYPGLTGPVRFRDDAPVTLPAAKPRRKHSLTADGGLDKEIANNVMAGKTSLTIGSTTITALNTSAGGVPTPETITLLPPEEEDRDEADGDEEDMENSSDEEEQEPDPESSEDKVVEQLEKNPDNPNPVKETENEEEKPVTKTTIANSREPIKQPCILIFDSLAGASRAKVVATLRDYLRVEYKVKHGKDRDFSKDILKGASPKVPQQTNFTDCGLYVLQYVEAFFQDPIQDYHIPIKTLQDWFIPDIVSRKRFDIQQLLLKLMGDQSIDIVSLNLPELNLSPMSRNLVGYSDSEEEMMHDEDEYGEYDNEEMFEECEEEEEEEMDEEEEEEGEDEDEMEEGEIGMEEGEIGMDCDQELLEEEMPKASSLKTYTVPRLNRSSSSSCSRGSGFLGFKTEEEMAEPRVVVMANESGTSPNMISDDGCQTDD